MLHVPKTHHDGGAAAPLIEDANFSDAFDSRLLRHLEIDLGGLHIEQSCAFASNTHFDFAETLRKYLRLHCCLIWTQSIRCLAMLWVGLSDTGFSGPKIFTIDGHQHPWCQWRWFILAARNDG